MIFLVGGAPRTGKSLLANKITREKGIPNLSLDIIVHTLKHEIPSYGISDVLPLETRAEKFLPFLKRMVKYSENSYSDYLIEGDVILPKQINKLRDLTFVKSLFLGYSELKLEQVLENEGINAWLTEETREKQESVIKYILDLSLIIKEGCATYGFDYVDMSGDFVSKLQKAFELL